MKFSVKFSCFSTCHVHGKCGQQSKNPLVQICLEDVKQKEDHDSGHTHVFLFSERTLSENFSGIFTAFREKQKICVSSFATSPLKNRGHQKCHFITHVYHDAKNGALKLVDEFSYYHCEMGSTWYWSFLMHDIYGQSVKMLNVKTYFVSKSKYQNMDQCLSLLKWHQHAMLKVKFF